MSLTLIPADPRVPDLPQGEVITRRADGHLWVDHADPRIVISLQLLDLIVRGECLPEVTIRLADFAFAWTGAVMRIEAANRTLVYRLTDYLPWYHGYIAEWPD